MAEQIVHKDVLSPVIKFGFAALIGFLGFYQYRQVAQAKHTRVSITTVSSAPCPEDESTTEPNFTTLSITQ